MSHTIPKVALILPTPTPYRDPMVELLYKCGQVELTVYYCAEATHDRPWDDTRHKKSSHVQILKNLTVYMRRPFFINPTIIQELNRGKFQVIVISGYSQFTSIVALLWSQVTNTPYIPICESHDRRDRKGWIVSLKRKIIPFLYKRASAWLAVGSFQKDYMVQYGADPKRTFIFPNTPDITYFKMESNKYKQVINEKKGFFGVNESKVICYVGRLIAIKNVDLLLEAFQIVKQEISDTALMIIGDGPECYNLMKYVRTKNLKGVYFTGFKQQSDLAAYYAISNVFVLPSFDEPWGVVVNEAMACSLPVIVSDRVGAAGDIVKNAYNGFVVKAGDAAELSIAILKILNDENLRERMGRRSLELIEKWDHSMGVENFICAIKCATEHKPKCHPQHCHTTSNLPKL